MLKLLAIAGPSAIAGSELGAVWGWSLFGALMVLFWVND